LERSAANLRVATAMGVTSAMSRPRGEGMQQRTGVGVDGKGRLVAAVGFDVGTTSEHVAQAARIVRSAAGRDAKKVPLPRRVRLDTQGTQSGRPKSNVVRGRAPHAGLHRPLSKTPSGSLAATTPALRGEVLPNPSTSIGALVSTWWCSKVLLPVSSVSAGSSGVFAAGWSDGSVELLDALSGQRLALLRHLSASTSATAICVFPLSHHSEGDNRSTSIPLDIGLMSSKNEADQVVGHSNILGTTKLDRPSVLRAGAGINIANVECYGVLSDHYYDKVSVAETQLVEGRQKHTAGVATKAKPTEHSTSGYSTAKSSAASFSTLDELRAPWGGADPAVVGGRQPKEKHHKPTTIKLHEKNYQLWGRQLSPDDISLNDPKPPEKVSTVKESEKNMTGRVQISNLCSRVVSGSPEGALHVWDTAKGNTMWTYLN
jgi:WD40 repeat protein